jgi:leucyl aminopeptidase
MSVILKFSGKSKLNKSKICVVFFKDYLKIDNENSEFSNTDIKLIIEFFSVLKSKKNEFITFDLSPSKKIILVNLKSNLNLYNLEKLGANFFDFIKKNFLYDLKFLEKNIEEFFTKNKLFLSAFIHGFKVKSYIFKKYKTKLDNKIYILNLPVKLKNLIENKNNKFNSLEEGINFTKDLVSEPGNILHPDEYVKRLKKLKSLGLKITIYDKKKLKKIGMNALLGVGQGSVRGSYLAAIEWRGSKDKQQPLAFVGKGVCFDTGGISLKPAKFMEDMTYDMAGSAVVVGLMKTLALRKAKVNVVGVVGLVENMPDGNAQRPGDIVKSYSGKTIEILNTDAEGRLVLADALSYTEKKFKPKFIVDLATLTGAIIVSLGSEYAGLFSNDDKISDQLYKAGEKVGEKVWRMPLNENYDKLIDSKKADIQNINYVGGAGSTTAAQFLQRFILNKTPWAHLDIAGMAFSKYGGALNSGGATGYGVRLLNQLIEDNYE